MTATRDAYPVLERLAYLNAGTFGPLARATLDAIAEQLRRDADEGRMGTAYFERMLALRASVREKLAAVVGVAPDRVALMTSTTEGVNLVLNGLGLGADDEVVTTDSEHFGLIGGLIASGAHGADCARRRRPAGEALDTILAEVTPRTKLIALSHVSWITGNRLPVGRCGRRPACRCSSTARSRPARSRSTPRSRTSTPCRRRSGSAGPT